MIRVLATALLLLHVSHTACLAQSTQTTEGDCSPAIQHVGGSVHVTCISVSSPEEARNLALSNLDEVILQISILVRSQKFLFLPSIELYEQRPTDANWLTVRDDMDLITKLIRAATESVLRYNPILELETDEELLLVLNLLRERTLLVNNLRMLENRPAPSEITGWVVTYRSLLMRLTEALEALRGRLSSPA